MGSMHLDSRQVFSEFIGFLAGERVLWSVIDYTAKDHSAEVTGTDYDSHVWFRGFLILEYGEASYSECLNLASYLFAWDATSEGHVFLAFDSPQVGFDFSNAVSVGALCFRR